MPPLTEVVEAVGLSVSIVRCSALIGAHRIDAESYRPEAIHAYSLLETLTHVQLDSRIAFVTDGQHGYHELDETSEIKDLTAQCIRNGYVDASKADRISAAMHARVQRSNCEAGDVVLSAAGTIGNAGVITADILPANMDQDLVRIKIYDQHFLNPWYVATFLNSEFGRIQTLRESTGQVQQHLSLDKVRDLRIPLLSRRDEVAEKAHQSFELFRKADALYTQAQALLTIELGLDRLDLSEGLYSVRRASEVVAAARVDAEYYKPKYERVMSVMGRSGQRIGTVAQLAKRRFEPQRGRLFDYIEIGDLSGDGHAESEQIWGEDAPSRAEWIVHNGDVITSTVRPIRRLSALIEPQQNGYVCSSGFAVLRPVTVAPQLLLLYLRLPIVCEVMDLYTTASMYPAIATTELLNLPITLPEDKMLQTELVSKVQTSRQARRDAKRLLTEAKAEVEQMIEEAAG